MKLGIYQSYIKEPQKFFAPSSPCRLSYSNSPPKHTRRMSCSDAPVYYIASPFPALPQLETHVEKGKEGKKVINVHINKVELVLQEFPQVKHQKLLKSKEDFVGFRRPNTSKTVVGTQIYRPLTVNARFFRRSSLR